MQHLHVDGNGHVHQIGFGHDDHEVDEGTLVVSPGGNLVLKAASEPLKDGFRYATEDEVEHWSDRYKAPDAAPASAPVAVAHDASPAAADEHAAK